MRLHAYGTHLTCLKFYYFLIIVKINLPLYPSKNNQKHMGKYKNAPQKN